MSPTLVTITQHKIFANLYHTDLKFITIKYKILITKKKQFVHIYIYIYIYIYTTFKKKKKLSQRGAFKNDPFNFLGEIRTLLL